VCRVCVTSVDFRALKPIKHQDNEIVVEGGGGRAVLLLPIYYVLGRYNLGDSMAGWSGACYRMVCKLLRQPNVQFMLAKATYLSLTTQPCDFPDGSTGSSGTSRTWTSRC
jgi:hypothetical protein